MASLLNKVFGNRIMEKLYCKCGDLITPEIVEYSNRCNEEGEDWCEYIINCATCGEFDLSGWGECDGDYFDAIADGLEDRYGYEQPINL